MLLQFPPPLSLSLSAKRTIQQAPPLFLHSFLDCICSLLDIPFYWTRSLEKPPSLIHSFLPSWRPFLHLLLLCPGYIRGCIPPPLPSTPPFLVYPSIQRTRAPLVRDIILFRVSNFKRYYSPFREPPPRILDLSRRAFPVRCAPGTHPSLSLFRSKCSLEMFRLYASCRFHLVSCSFRFAFFTRGEGKFLCTFDRRRREGQKCILTRRRQSHRFYRLSFSFSRSAPTKINMDGEFDAPVFLERWRNEK